MDDKSELERFRAQRVTALYRLDMIEKGAQLHYEDGTPVDMKSEAQRLKDQVADMDRRIRNLEEKIKRQSMN